MNITNANCDVVAITGYNINTNDQGVYVKWDAFNGNSYQTDTITWEELKKNGYEFNMSDYFGNNSDLYKNGVPLFNQKIALDVEEGASANDIATAIQGTKYSPFYGVSAVPNFLSNPSSGMSGAGGGFSPIVLYEAHKAGKFSYDVQNNTDIITPADLNGNVPTDGTVAKNLTVYPQATSVQQAETSTEGWEFTYYVEGVGKATAVSNMVTATSGNNIDICSSGTLGDVMRAADKVESWGSGEIIIGFNVTAENEYAPGKDFVHSFELRIRMNQGDTKDTVLQKINDSLDQDTSLDLSLYSQKVVGSISTPIANAVTATIPVYAETEKQNSRFWVQAGRESHDKIELTYENLNVEKLGLQNTNVLTEEASRNAIEQVASAIQTVSAQRSTFGAFQNRLEHAYNINENTSENTTAAESQIRDTDMAEMMVQYSNQSILLQAGQSMLTQANSSNEYVLQLLQ